MKLLVTDSYKDSSRILADMFEEVIRQDKRALLGLATGSSPMGLYQCLAEDFAEGKVDFSEVRTINLDEYAGLSRTHVQSFGYFMDRHLFSKVNIEENNIMLIDGTASPLDECRRYQDFLDRNEIDILVLGIGVNGHIGFNEPAPFFEADTHITELEADTIRANARFFDRESDVPKRAVTMGISGITRAKKVVLIASGEAKADAINRLFTDGKIDPMLPCSILKICRDVIVIIDRELKDTAVTGKNNSH